MLIRAALIAPMLALSACGQDADQPEPSPAETKSSEAPEVSPMVEILTNEISLIGTDGQQIGSGGITGGPHGILLRLEIAAGGLSPGWHGLHLHQVGDCSDVGVFKKSGGHVGKVEGGHGLLNAAGPEGGDIPNIYAHADGSAGYEAFSTLTSFSDLYDEDGAAIIIHANPDDHLTQPIGGAGPRVACGVIE